MKLIFTLLLCLCFLPFSAWSQEKIQKVMVGPYNNQMRILIAFIEPMENGMKTESMIIDMDSIKDSKEQAESVTVDLTSTIRSLETGKKDQKVLVLRWNKKGEVEMKCEGKWTKQNSTPATEKIIETAKVIFQNVSLNSKEATEASLSSDVMQRVETALKSLTVENFSCLRLLN